MKAVAIGVVIALAIVAFPMDAVGAEEFSVIGTSEAAPCIWGFEDECIIPAYECFQPRRLYCE